MLLFTRTILLTILTAIFAGPLQASSNGLFLNDDTAGIHYVGNINDSIVSNSRLDAGALYSQGPDPRNLLFSAGLELNNYNINFDNQSQLIPKAGLFWADFLDANVTAFGAGGLYRLPQTEERKYDVWAELLAAPAITTFTRGKYLWSLKLQLDYPLTKEATANLGYRKIMIKLEDEREDAFDQGFYIGLSTQF